MCRHGRIYIFFTVKNLFSVVLISYSYLFQYVWFLTLHIFFETSKNFPLCFSFLLIHSRETQVNLIWEKPLEAQAMTSSKLIPATETDRLLSALSY